MTIEIKKNTTETTIEIVGRLDTITAPALDKTINEDIGDTKNLILDVKAWSTSPAQDFVYCFPHRRKCRKSAL